MNENLIAILILLVYFSPIFYQLVLVIKERKRGNRLPYKKFLKITKYSFLILLPFLIAFGVLCHINFLDYEKPYTFDKYDQITLENFRGLEFFRETLYGSKKFAYIVTTIETDIDENSVTVQSLFHPSRSFVYNQEAFSKELLKHEKYHFKITELYARKAKQKIADLQTFSEDKIEGIIEKTKTKERAFQREYDYNTFHSYVLSEQIRYENTIDSLLHSLNQFKKPKIIINEKN